MCYKLILYFLQWALLYAAKQSLYTSAAATLSPSALLIVNNMQELLRLLSLSLRARWQVIVGTRPIILQVMERQV